MTISNDVKTISADRLPALAAAWQSWAQAQVAGVKADMQALVDAAEAKTADLQEQLDAALTKLSTAMAEAQKDHADEIAALTAAIDAAAPPAGAGA